MQEYQPKIAFKQRFQLMHKRDLQKMTINSLKNPNTSRTVISFNMVKFYTSIT